MPDKPKGWNELTDRDKCLVSSIALVLLGIPLICIDIQVTRVLWNWFVAAIFHTVFLSWWQTAGLYVVYMQTLFKPNIIYIEPTWYMHKQVWRWIAFTPLCMMIIGGIIKMIIR